MKIPVIKPFFGREEERAVIDTLRSGWVVQGPKVEEFEQKIASYIGAKYAVATSSCTTALHLALIAAGIGPGDEVIVPSLSFIATANSVLYAAATPVFADIDPKTYNIDPNDVAKKITNKTKAIIAVHQIGLCADMDGLKKIVEDRKLKLEAGKETRNLKLDISGIKHQPSSQASSLKLQPSKITIIEDAACALGAKYHDKFAGTLGDIAAFSFHPRKAMTTGEGGMITTNNKKWADHTRVLRAHAMSVSDRARHEAKKVIIEEYHELGYNYRMTDIQAAIGIAQFLKYPKILKKRRTLAQRYTKAFKNHPNIIPPYEPPDYIHTYQSYQVRITNTNKSTEDIMQTLLEQGIATRRGVMATHMTHFYKKIMGNPPAGRLPETEKAEKETLIIPLYPQMTVKEQDYVIGNLLKVFS